MISYLKKWTMSSQAIVLFLSFSCFLVLPFFNETYRPVDFYLTVWTSWTRGRFVRCTVNFDIFSSIGRLALIDGNWNSLWNTVGERKRERGRRLMRFMTVLHWPCTLSWSGSGNGPSSFGLCMMRRRDFKKRSWRSVASFRRAKKIGCAINDALERVEWN